MTKDKLFGTDGIRGRIDSDFLQPHNIIKLGSIIADIIQELNSSNKSVIIARDTRASGIYIEQALLAGLSSKGISCTLLGVLPTGALALATKSQNATFGLMISASHNPYFDNGLKIFDKMGFKISKDLEQYIEKSFFGSTFSKINPEQKPGQISLDDESINRYLLQIKKPAQKLKNKKIVIDAANGAAYKILPKLFEDFLSCVDFIGASPDGKNINFHTGTEFPENLRAQVLKTKADLGIAFDGDADRVIIIDEKGNIIDGDILMAVMAIDLKQQGLLKKDIIIATIMSGNGLDNALKPFGIKVCRVDVGDRNVVRHMRELETNFGGESSGHMILLDKSTTADGIIMAMEIIDLWLRDGRPFSELCSFFVSTPRLLKDINVIQKTPLDLMPNTNKALLDANLKLKDSGRAFLRYSGTEMKARLLVEAKTHRDCQEIADNIIREFHHEIKQ